MSVLTAMPPELIRTVAGLALVGSLSSALTSALASQSDRSAGMITFVVSASGLTIAGIGAPFWGLLAGLAVLAFDAAKASFLADKVRPSL